MQRKETVGSIKHAGKQNLASWLIQGLFHSRTSRLRIHCKRNLASWLIQGLPWVAAAGMAWHSLAPCWAQRLPADPVEELRQVLRAPVRELGFRERNIRKWTTSLHGLNDLARALVLQEWRDDDTDEKVAALDQAQRTALAERFDREVRAILKGGEPVSRMAVANLIGEMGVSARGIRTRHSLAHRFGPDLADLVENGPPGVREPAARALGRIQPDPQVAAPALGKLLGSPEPSERRAAAEGLVHLMGVATELAAQSRNAVGASATRGDVVQVGCLVVPAASKGLGDPDTEVRLRSAEAVAQAAAALDRLILDSRPPEDESDWAEYRKLIQEEQAELLPLVLALCQQGAGLARAATDACAEVRLVARQTLEDMAASRLRIQRRAARIEAGASNSGGAPSGLTILPIALKVIDDPLLEGLRPALEALAAGVADPDVRARRAAIDVLESLGAEARPAAPALVRALSDADRFVRWAAARTLGKMGPVEPATAVPALARLLQGEDLDLSLTAAAALEHYGSAARNALPALVQAMHGRDAELRIAALHAVQGIGPDAQPALPACTAALLDRDARVRLKAAHVLGRFGPFARAAVPVLRQVLTDSNWEVQRAAAEALLQIQQR